MTEFAESNHNLRPDGKRCWKPRKGLINPAERMEELRQKEDHNVNEVSTTGQPVTKPRVIVQRDIPLDASDRTEERK